MHQIKNGYLKLFYATAVIMWFKTSTELLETRLVKELLNNSWGIIFVNWYQEPGRWQSEHMELNFTQSTSQLTYFWQQFHEKKWDDAKWNSSLNNTGGKVHFWGDFTSGKKSSRSW